MRQLTIYDQPIERSYFDTTDLSTKDQIKAEATAKMQDDKILAIFKKHSPLGPSVCWKLYEKEYGMILLTSLRRSISNLTKAELLTKTSVKQIGAYKKPEYVWKYNSLNR